MEKMILHLSTLWTIFLAATFKPANSSVDFETPDNPSIVYTYNRYTDVKETCASLSSKASELEPDDDRGTRLRDELSFLNGDWDQDSGGSSLLMPFVENSDRKYRTSSNPYLKLVSFWVSDVVPARGTKSMVSVSAVMEIGIVQEHPLNYKPYDWSAGFKTKPGSSEMTILFEGVYFQTNENEGERLMCLLGTSEIPITNQMVELEDTTNGFYQKFENKPSVVKEDRIMLVLRYPKSFTLTRGIIRGEMRSLRQKWDPSYFDDVHISSRPNHHSKYRFGAHKLLAKACSPYPYPDKFADMDLMTFKGDAFCDRIWSFMFKKTFYFAPNWESGGYDDDYDGKLGPFIIGKRFKGKEERLTNLKLFVENLECALGVDGDMTQIRNVSVLFRLLYLSDDRYLNEDRTGSSGMTLSAEGTWESSGGQLCMVGCLGIDGEISDRCNSRISIYLPQAFTITQRNMLFGVITGIDEKKPQATLLFERAVHPRDVWRWLRLQWSYQYSKIKQVRILWGRNKFSLLHKSLLVYPSAGNNRTVSFSRLEDELSLHVNALPSSFYTKNSSRVQVDLEVLSIGPYVGEYLDEKNDSKTFATNDEAIEISGYITISGKNFSNISLSFEGLYDPVLGKMYAVGCRDFRAFLELIKKGKNLERGMDCMIDVKIEYPARNLWWLMNPRAKIFVSNKRSKEDPLYFRPITLISDLISYKTKFGEIILQKTCEGILRILLLFAAALSASSQLRYMKNRVDSTAHTSLVMLGVQAIGYATPLITLTETLFEWKVLESHSHQTNEDLKKFPRFHLIEQVTRALLLIALFLTLKLFQKVWETRSRHHLDRPNKPKTLNLSEKKVVLITASVHAFGFLVTQGLLKNPNEEIPQRLRCTYPAKLIQWLIKLDCYAGVVQDLFLLPQTVTNSLWGIKGKPLRKSYYLGLTAIRVLVHVYDYLRHPVPDPYYSNSDKDYMGKETSLNFGIVTTTVFIILPAVVVYVQQRRDFGRIQKNLMGAKW